VVLLFPRGLAGLMTDQVIRASRACARRGHGNGAEPGTGGVAHHGQQHRLSPRARKRLGLVRRLQGGERAQSLYDKGELRVIIGPNGAGKTTVLDLICGRTKLTEGSIKFKDQEITTRKEQEIVRLGIGRKFQTPSIYEDLTVFENLEISYPRGRSVAGALFWKRTDEITERVREIARMIFLETQLDRLAEELSHGRSNGSRSACC